MTHEPYDLYGGMPPHEDTETSREAAEAIVPHAATQRARVYRFLVARGGATSDEVMVALGIPSNTLNPRMRELVLKGVVRDSGQRRLTRSGRQAIVWVVRDAGDGG